MAGKIRRSFTADIVRCLLFLCLAQVRMLTYLHCSLFWFAWTSYPSVHWIVPIIASSLFGAGIYIVILGVLNYVVDSYQTYSASALAGVILIRNLVGAGKNKPALVQQC